MGESAGDAVDVWVAFAKQLAARDKLSRTVQYWFKFVVWRLEQAAGPKPTKEAAALIKMYAGASKNIGNARKLFRLGTFIDALRSAYKKARGDLALEPALAILQDLSNAAYLWYDALQWLAAVQLFVPPQGDKALARSRFQFWAVRILLALVQLAFKLNKNTLKLQQARESQSSDKIAKLQEEGVELKMETVKQALDLWIPLSGLGYGPFNAGQVGLFGTVTSIIGCWQKWPASKK